MAEGIERPQADRGRLLLRAGEGERRPRLPHLRCEPRGARAARDPGEVGVDQRRGRVVTARRVKTGMKPKTFEIRRNDDGSLDEVVACRPRFVHLEQMDTDSWWLRIDIDGKRAVVVNFWTGHLRRGCRCLAGGASIRAEAEMD